MTLFLLLAGCSGRGGGDDDDEGAGDGDSDSDGDSDGDSDSDGDTDSDADGDTDADGDGDAARRVFVTSGTTGGELAAWADGDGAAGADALCAEAAAAADLDGVFRAWVSTSAEDAIDRIADVGPWEDAEGTTIFADRAGLVAPPLSGLWLDERGEFLASERVWTGTSSDGRHDQVDGACADWTSGAMTELAAIGQVGRQDGGAWTDYAATTCDQDGHLICFEQ